MSKVSCAVTETQKGDTAPVSKEFATQKLGPCLISTNAMGGLFPELRTRWKPSASAMSKDAPSGAVYSDKAVAGELDYVSLAQKREGGLRVSLSDLETVGVRGLVVEV